MLGKSSLDEFKNGFVLLSIAGTPASISKTEYYCENHKYLRLALMCNGMKYAEDELGIIPISDFLSIYLLIRKDQKHLLVGTLLKNGIEITPPVKTQLLFVKEVPPFNYKIYFRKRRLFFEA